jgi:hypothetical protein
MFIPLLASSCLSFCPRLGFLEDDHERRIQLCIEGVLFNKNLLEREGMKQESMGEAAR